MFLVLAAVVFAEDYDVGDDTEWARPSDPKFYDTWAAGKTLRVGDELGEFAFLFLLNRFFTFHRLILIVHILLFIHKAYIAHAEERFVITI